MCTFLTPYPAKVVMNRHSLWANIRYKRDKPCIEKICTFNQQRGGVAAVAVDKERGSALHRGRLISRTLPPPPLR